METLPLIYLFIVGLCAGSFALAMTMRMYARKPWVNDRSRCDYCKKTLAWYDLVPLISWVSTRGHCRYCHKRLSRFYPVVELSTGLAFVVSYLAWPYGFAKMGILLFVLWAVMITLMVSLVIFDLKWFLLPDRITYTLIGLAGASKLFQVIYYQDFDRIPGIIIGVVVGAGVFFALYVYSQGKYIGGGDIKLGLFYGILLGSGFKSLLVMSIGSLIGTAIMLPALIRRSKKMTSMVPFGPSLILATFILYLYGDRIIEILMSTYLFP
jgi:prepilin signal peptidase PulO-like enzyme (type II secretory pathway)